MKLSPYKILLTSILLICSNIFALPKSELIQALKTKKDYIVLSVPVKMYTLDPTKAINAHTKFTLPLIFEPLISINSHQELQSILAKSWQISPDRKSIIITIKQNHHFSDSSEVTAQDVIDSIYRLCSIDSKNFSELKGLVGCEEHARSKKITPEVYALGKYLVRFNIANNPTTFLYQLSSPTAVITKVTKKGLVGSGLYMVEENNNIHLSLQKNRFYTGEATIKNAGLVLFYTSDHDVLSTLAKERHDGAIMYRLKELWGFHDARFKLIKSNPNITEILVLNNQRFPFNKPLVRKALSNAIYNSFNYTCITGSHKAFGIIPTGIGGSIANMPPASLREVTPKELFKSVPELKNKKASVVIHQLYDVKNDCESEQIAKIAKKFNINMSFKYHHEYLDLLKLEFNHNNDGFIDLYILKNREAYNMIRFFTKNGANHAHLSSLNIDDMLNKASSAPSSQQRFQSYRKIAQYLQDQNIIIPIFYMDHGNLMNKCLSGIADDFFFNPYFYLPQLSKIKNCVN